MKTLTRRSFLATGVSAGAVLLAACSAPAAPTPAPAATAAPTGAPATAAPAAVPAASSSPTAGAKPAAAATATGKRGGTVHFAVTSDPLLNPIMTGDVSGVVMTKLLFNGLTRPDRETLEPRPDLAVSWEATDNGATWTFKLRDGVKWHDGAPFTAEDVKFTFESILDPKVNTVMRGHFKSLKGVDAIDKTTVRFALKEPFSAFPAFMGHLGTVCVGIIPKHALTGQDLNTTAFNKTAPIGTGPFKFKELKAADHVTLVANDDYHFGRPLLDTFNWKILPDANTQIAQVRTGELTVALVSPAQAQSLQNVPDVKVQNAPRVGFSYVGLNKSRPLFKEVRVRKAMMHALDREAIIKKIYLDQYKLASGPIPPAISWAHDAEVTKYGFDLAKAKALMAEAGWTPGADGVLTKEGQRFAFKMTGSRSPVNEQTLAAYQQAWKALGMETTIELLEFGVFINQRRDSHDYDMMQHGWSLPPDPDQFNYWHSTAITGGGLNAGEYVNPEVDKLLEEGRKSLDQAKRKEAYSKLQKLMADDLPELWLWYSAEIRAVSTKLLGFGPKSYYDVGLHYANEWSLA
jgi:peptide/nickel transport system substrate-binding protein